MTGRSAATIASLVLLAAVSACTNFFEVPIETPISPKMDVSRFQRVLVAGFISGGTEDVDANLETVRLLRSQLRSKSSLRVIEADVLPLAELAVEQQSKTAASAAVVPPQISPVPGLAVAPDGQAAGQAAPLPPVAPPPAAVDLSKIRSEKDFEKYQGIFADVAFWKKIGEEYENPLIVTGTVLFQPKQTAGFVNQNQEVYDNLGRRTVVPRRMYVERKGFTLTPTFIFIDGKTGVLIYRETMTQEVLYNPQQNTPALSSYFELMDQIIPSFLGALSTQKVRGTRVLLR
jgi:hypothetical protein